MSKIGVNGKLFLLTCSISSWRSDWLSFPMTSIAAQSAQADPAIFPKGCIRDTHQIVHKFNDNYGHILGI